MVDMYIRRAINSATSVGLLAIDLSKVYPDLLKVRENSLRFVAGRIPMEA